MRKINTISAAILLVILFITGCAKDPIQGPPGPIGQTGVNGTNGVNGIDGTNGVNGTDGNANVIGSNTVTIYSSDWSNSSGVYSANITLGAITQSIIDKGTVLVYRKYGSEWVLLPITKGVNLTAYSFGLGYISLVNYNTDFSSNNNPGAVTFRVVIISSN